MREFNTCTGTYKGERITVTSTGIGAPSAAIAMEEMYACGMEVAVRMGTVMSIQDDMLGQFIIPIASMRRESTSKTYVEESYPAVADLELVNILNQTAADFGKRSLNGVSCTMDGFYTQMHDSRFSKECGRDLSRVFEELRALHVCGIDMESACMLTVGRLMGVKTAVITMVTVLENLKETRKGRSAPTRRRSYAVSRWRASGGTRRRTGRKRISAETKTETEKGRIKWRSESCWQSTGNL